MAAAASVQSRASKLDQAATGIWRSGARYLGLGLFLIWALVLSGVFDQTFSSPGVLQALELRGLLQEKQSQVEGLEAELRILEENVKLFEKNDLAIEHEIRRTLGFAAADEIVFDFSSSERNTLPARPGTREAPQLGEDRPRDPDGAGGRLTAVSPFKKFFLPVTVRRGEGGGQSL